MGQVPFRHKLLSESWIVSIGIAEHRRTEKQPFNVVTLIEIDSQLRQFALI